MSTILVTTGATVTFTRLLETLIDISLLEEFITNGVIKLIIQYGNEIKNGKNLSSDIFHDILEKSGVISALGLKPTTSSEQTVANFTSSRFTLSVLPFSPTISKYIDQADIVVSHAGTGSIVDVLRADKKLIVVVNEDLMDNHQAEVAEEFAKLNYCVHSDNNKTALMSHIRQFLDDSVKLRPFPPQQKSIVQSIIFQEANK